ncbi:MICAL-like protein 1 isoform X2 [Wyeomyia smithii]|nr:MICAL-like protein 1 isoform X2 [Wyeomyia smithii]
MVKYEVPDRFSILTYLSQYYRVFSNQESANNNKKTVTKEPKSDDLMANPSAFVGVPKREPCRKCGNPVFFAERISFEKKLYHRSCLKCARCGTQLTLGSFYETETDGEYCCETCPDEEIQLAERRCSISSPEKRSIVVATSDDSSNDSARLTRSSRVLERISFFESAPLSDEEKTSNLVRRARMTSFLKDSLNKSDEHNNSELETNAKEPLSASESEEDSSDVEDNRDLPALAPIEPPYLQDSVPAGKILPLLEVLPELNGSEGTSHDEFYENKDQFVPHLEKDSGELSVLPQLSICNGSIVDSSENIKTDAVVQENGCEDKLQQSEKISDDQSCNQESTDHTENDVVLFESMESESAQVNSFEIAEALNKAVVNDNIVLSEVPNIKIEEAPTHEKCTENNVNETEQISTSIDIVHDKPLKSLTTANVVNQNSDESKEEYPSDLNPFSDESDEDPSQINTKPVPSARRVSTNPFGSDDEEESQHQNIKPPRPPLPKIKPTVPANPFDDTNDDEPEKEIVPVIVKPSPRRTPVPTPRKQHNHNDSISSMETSLLSSQFGGSTISLASSMDSGPSSTTISRRKKSKAPDIPNVAITKVSNENLSSMQTTPRKKRPAPAPPTISSTSLQENSKLSPNPSQRLITIDASLFTNEGESKDVPSVVSSSESVVYRRTIVPLKVDDDSPTLEATTSERQWEKMKDNKEAQNRNRQSQTSPIGSFQQESFNGIMSNKSQQGKWKRRKGPAPALPMPLPERKTIKMLPLKEIRQEMDIIETQQQGLEKQGVVLEQMIRERCEGIGPEMDITGIQTNSKEVEDLIMQLFELVNEKNELFRRQAELMYLRRQHRLEQEQADLEYEIRILMAQPERNKTDSDKEKEETLIARLVEIVQMRNEVIDCLEMDRLREAEEDMSIKQSIEERTANQQKHGKKDSDTEKPVTGDVSIKLSKKEKKKLKDAKKLLKLKKIDSEKDADETENSIKEKKKKKKFFADFLHHK